MQWETEWEIQGTLSLSDVVRFCYFDLCRRMPLFAGVFVAFAVGVGVLLKGELTRAELTPFIEAGALCFLVVLAIVFMLPYRNAKRQYASQHCLQESMKFDFTEKGVELEGPSVYSNFPWARVWRIYETRSAFFIDQNARAGVLLPKRFFADEADIQKWRIFVLGKLAKPSTFRGLTWFSALF